MKIDFKIAEVPTNEEGPEFVPYYVAGPLKIIIDNDLFFDENYILLMELAVVIQKWLRRVRRKVGVHSFVYESMEYEGALFSFRLKKPGLYQIELDPELQEHSTYNSRLLVTKDEITNAFEQYIENLRDGLMVNYNIDLDLYIHVDHDEELPYRTIL